MSGVAAGDDWFEGREVASRVFAAPRELVFEMWTVAEHFARWFGPRGATISACELDPRPGGVLRFAHHFADGSTLYVKGAFQEVVPPQHLMFAVRFVDENGQPGRHPHLPDWPVDAVGETRVSFEETAGGTRVTVHQRITPAEAAASAAVARERPLARAGWVEVLDRLAERLREGKEHSR